MTSVKVTLVQTKKGLHKLAYRIKQNGNYGTLLTDLSVEPHEWSQQLQTIIPTAHVKRNIYLGYIQSRIKADVDFINGLLNDSPHTTHRSNSFSAFISEAYALYKRENSLSSFASEVIEKFYINRQYRTAETYQTAINSFRKFLSFYPFASPIWVDAKEPDILLQCLSDSIIETYEYHLRNKGLQPNTTSFYMRILRAIYNRAAEKNLVNASNPFHHVYTGVDKTIKRAISLSSLKKITNMDLSGNPSLEYARDMFLLSLYMQGMSFVDMAYLRISDLRDGYICYRRSKTGKTIWIKWLDDMKRIVDKYHTNPPFLLPILHSDSDPISLRKQYLRKSYSINRALKKVAAYAGINTNLTLYCARHSWATAAQAKGISVGTISRGMGHESESTTRIYLGMLGTNTVDRANRLIINAISKTAQDCNMDTPRSIDTTRVLASKSRHNSGRRQR